VVGWWGGGVVVVMVAFSLAFSMPRLLIRRNAFLVLNLRLDIVNRVPGLNIKRGRLTNQRLDKDLHVSSEAQHQM
jgi:hypothetical protein